MNKTKIDWCDSTWNPVTGCRHNCQYCYARGIVKRFGSGDGSDSAVFELDAPFREEDIHCETGERVYGKIEPYPYGFSPTLHRYRLDEYREKKGRNIFVCSMADLFGDWVPDSWIEEVFDACQKAPQHNYLFLTKNPKRYESICNGYMPPNMWFGWSRTGPLGKDFSFTTHHSTQSFVSLEPLLKPFDEFNVRGVEWVIVGAETGRRKDKVIPERRWIEDIVNECRKFGTPVFMKSSLADIWGEPLIQEFPKQLIRNI